MSVDFPGCGIGNAESSLDELARLTDTAGSTPVASVEVRRRAADPATLIGSGQVEDLVRESQSLDVDVVVFDNDLTPGQQRNLAQLFKCDVVDRVAVILDIFAQHATSREGMLQVELALLQYHLPRLRGRGVELSRLGGGIGTRGPGETRLETDRRRISRRIAHIRGRLTDLQKVRENQRKSRLSATTPLLSLVGYTNAGKSTLLNALTDSDALVQDQLFSTLDSTTRRLELPNGRQVLLTDTVGFVQRLPHQLVEAFHSTLQETLQADLLVHVVDASEQGVRSRIKAVRQVLDSIGAGDIPELMVLNKADLARPSRLAQIGLSFPDAISVSALGGHGLDALLDGLGDRLTQGHVQVELLVPYADGQVLDELRRTAQIRREDHGADGTFLVVLLPPAWVGRYRRYAT